LVDVRPQPRPIVACDFVVSTTVSLRTIYTLVLMEIGSRRILHVNSTSHPTAEWTTQQLREAFVPEHRWRYLLHDRDSIFSASLDDAVRSFGVTVLKSPPRCPKANAFCERLIGSLRRECLDWIIPLGESHIRSVTREWAEHYNRGRPHSALGSVPEPPTESLPRNSRTSIACPAAHASLPSQSSAACITNTRSIEPHNPLV